MHTHCKAWREWRQRSPPPHRRCSPPPGRTGGAGRGLLWVKHKSFSANKSRCSFSAELPAFFFFSTVQATASFIGNRAAADCSLPVCASLRLQNVTASRERRSRMGARRVNLLGAGGGNTIYVGESIGPFVLRPLLQGSWQSALENNHCAAQDAQREKKNEAISTRTKHSGLNCFFSFLDFPLSRDWMASLLDKRSITLRVLVTPDALTGVTIQPYHSWIWQQVYSHTRLRCCPFEVNWQQTHQQQNRAMFCPRFLKWWMKKMVVKQLQNYYSYTSRKCIYVAAKN